MRCISKNTAENTSSNWTLRLIGIVARSEEKTHGPGRLGCSDVWHSVLGWGSHLMKSINAIALTAVLLLASSLTGDQPDSVSTQHAVPAVKLPLIDGSVRFAVIGDNGTGETPEYEVAGQMERFREVVKYDFVVMDGDNIYGGHKASDFQRKFEQPFKPLLDAGIKFYSSLGNHDDPDVERNYKPYIMGGKRYYSFQKGDVEFFALDSNYVDP
jgi:hypothetical protein